METFSALLVLCEGNPPGSGEFPPHRSFNAGIWCCLSCSPQKAARQTLELPVIWNVMTLIWQYSNGLVNKKCPDHVYVKGKYLGHDDVIKWKHFPRYWPFVRGIHRWSVNSPHKGQWRGALMISFICAWINTWVNNRMAGDLRRHRAHYGVIVMTMNSFIGFSADMCNHHERNWVVNNRLSPLITDVLRSVGLMDKLSLTKLYPVINRNKGGRSCKYFHTNHKNVTNQTTVYSKKSAHCPRFVVFNCSLS